MFDGYFSHPRAEAAMSRDRRNNFRVEWNSPGRIELNGRLICSCTVSNLSNGGAKISGFKSASIPDEFMLTVIGLGALPHKCRVMWRAGGELGIQFADDDESRPESKKRRRVRDPAIS
jgi:PilZ domain